MGCHSLGDCPVLHCGERMSAVATRLTFVGEAMTIAIFGANGATGRLLVAQALDAGHKVVAATRNPENFPFRRDGLHVAQADVYDAERVSDVVAGCEAVLSTLGVAFTREPITVYSRGVKNIITAMRRHEIRRLVVVSSSATYPHYHADGGFLLNRVMQPLVTATIGRTTYADMRRMEELVRASDLDWTIVRPSGLFDLSEVTDYRLDEDEAPGVFTSRMDLAACILAQLDDHRFVRKNVAVTTTSVKPRMLQMILTEAFKKS
jgi:putative NADH-flavin reductase